MLKFIQFLFLIGIYHVSFAQISLQEGPKTKRDFNDYHLGFILADSTKLYAVDNNLTGKPVVNCYDKKSLEFIKEIKLNKDDQWSNFNQLTHVFYLNKSIYSILVKEVRNQPKVIYLIKLQLDNELETKIVLDTIQPNDLNTDFDIVVNEEENAFVYVKKNLQLANSASQTIFLKAYSQTNEPIWTHTIALPNGENQYMFSNWIFTGDNEISFLAKNIVDLYKPNIELANAEENTYVLFNYNHNQDKLREIEISLHKRYISKIIFVSSKEKLIVAGIYSSSKSFNPDGVFNLIFDADFRKTSHLLHDFTDKEITYFRSKKKETIGVKITSPFKPDYVNDFLLKDIALLENGDFVVLTEEYRKEWEDNTANMAKNQTASSSNIYFHQNILLFWFGKDGALKNSYGIDKNQMSHSENDPKNSFLYGLNKNDLFLFYNDHPKNLDANNLNTKTLRSTKKKFLKCIQVNEKSKKTVLTTASSSRKKGAIVSFGEQLQDGSIYFNSTKSFFKRAILKFYFPK